MGGKRKKSNNGPIKKESKYKIPSRFDCPLCDSKATIVVKIFRITSDATVRCRNCGAGGEKRWNVLRLEKPVDVFFRFHEALIQKDQQDLQRVELSREAQQARLSTGGLMPSSAHLGDGIAAPHDPVAPGGDASWTGDSGAAAASAAVSGGARHVRSLGELQRKLAMASAGASRNIDLGDDYEAEAEGAASHYFAPRPEVHNGRDDDDDEYDNLFQ